MKKISKICKIVLILMFVLILICTVMYVWGIISEDIYLKLFKTFGCTALISIFIGIFSYDI